MKLVSVRRTCGVGILLFGALVVFSQSGFAQSDPSVGTWQLNVAKSKYDPGPAPKSNTLTIEAAGQGVKVNTKGIDAAGNPTGTQYATALDGKDTPVTLTGSTDYDTVALKRIDERTVEGTRKKAGKVVQTYSRVVSQDGKTMTITTKGTNAKGEKVNNVVVYEKK
jgi:hypothetical protein